MPNRPPKNKIVLEGGTRDYSQPYYIEDHDKVYDYMVKDGMLFAKRKKSNDWTDLSKALPSDKYDLAVSRIRSMYPDVMDKSPIDVTSPITRRTPSSISSESLNIPPTDASELGIPKLNANKGYPYDDANPGITPPNDGSFLDSIQGEIDALSGQIDDSYKNSLEDSKNAANRSAFRSAMAAGVKSLEGLQDTYTEPVVRNTSLLGGEYRKTPVSVVEQLASKLRSQVSTQANNLIKSGASPSEVGAYLAELQSKALDAESNLRFNFYNNNENLDRNRFKALRDVTYTNEANRIKAQSETRDTQNQVLVNSLDNVTNFINNQETIGNNRLNFDRNAENYYYSNKLDLMQNKLNLKSLEALNLRSKEETDRMLKAFEIALKISQQQPANPLPKITPATPQ